MFLLSPRVSHGRGLCMVVSGGIVEEYGRKRCGLHWLPDSSWGHKKRSVYVAHNSTGLAKSFAIIQRYVRALSMAGARSDDGKEHWSLDEYGLEMNQATLHGCNDGLGTIRDVEP